MSKKIDGDNIIWGIMLYGTIITMSTLVVGIFYIGGSFIFEYNLHYYTLKILLAAALLLLAIYIAGTIITEIW